VLSKAIPCGWNSSCSDVNGLTAGANPGSWPPHPCHSACYCVVAVTCARCYVQCDFPESVSCYQAMGQRAGFSAAECAVCGKNDLATVMVYRA